jgi:hypothetical protein
MPRGERAITVRTMPRKKTNKVVLAARVSEAEFKALEEMAARDEITMTQIIREFLRTLPTYRPAGTKPPSHRSKD